MADYKYSNFGEFEDEFVEDVLVVNTKTADVVSRVGKYIDDFVVAAFNQYTSGGFFSLDASKKGRVDLWVGHPNTPDSTDFDKYLQVDFEKFLQDELENQDDADDIQKIADILTKYGEKFNQLAERVRKEDE